MKNSLPKKCSFLTMKSREHSTNEIICLNLFLQWLPEYRYSKYEPFKKVPTNFFFKVCHCHHCLSSENYSYSGILSEKSI